MAILKHIESGDAQEANEAVTQALEHFAKKDFEQFHAFLHFAIDISLLIHLARIHWGVELKTNPGLTKFIFGERPE